MISLKKNNRTYSKFCSRTCFISMNFQILRDVLHFMKGPESAEVVRSFIKLYKLQQEQINMQNIESKQSIIDLIEKEKKEIEKLEKQNELYEKKIYSISEINGLLVIKPQKSQYNVFHYRNKKYKDLSQQMTNLTNELREQLAKKPKLSVPATRRPLTQEMKDNIEEFIKSQEQLENKKIENNFYNETQDSKLYSLLDEVKDLYYVCANQGLDVSNFDQASFISRILRV